MVARASGGVQRRPFRGPDSGRLGSDRRRRGAQARRQHGSGRAVPARPGAGARGAVSVAAVGDAAPGEVGRLPPADVTGRRRGLSGSRKHFAGAGAPLRDSDGEASCRGHGWTAAVQAAQHAPRADCLGGPARPPTSPVRGGYRIRARRLQPGPAREEEPCRLSDDPDAATGHLVDARHPNHVGASARGPAGAERTASVVSRSVRGGMGGPRRPGADGHVAHDPVGGTRGRTRRGRAAARRGPEHGGGGAGCESGSLAGLDLPPATGRIGSGSEGARLQPSSCPRRRCCGSFLPTGVSRSSASTDRCGWKSGRTRSNHSPATLGS